MTELESDEVSMVDGGLLFVLALVAPELAAIALGAAIYIVGDYVSDK